eukprot:TRINITY_DN15477_c0_g1_i3.p1 TRINITY_DN15477_c0_g1~~TRINITY_DN15477_c0_g1_i3.p1  ORF type:complete len:210 (-),score=16.31 TRINITY_DN15477_c0_g1_i3:76-657(-)
MGNGNAQPRKDKIDILYATPEIRDPGQITTFRSAKVQRFYESTMQMTSKADNNERLPHVAPNCSALIRKAEHDASTVMKPKEIEWRTKYFYTDQSNAERIFEVAREKKQEEVQKQEARRLRKLERRLARQATGLDVSTSHSPQSSLSPSPRLCSSPPRKSNHSRPTSPTSQHAGRTRSRPMSPKSPMSATGRP